MTDLIECQRCQEPTPDTDPASWPICDACKAFLELVDSIETATRAYLTARDEMQRQPVEKPGRKVWRAWRDARDEYNRWLTPERVLELCERVSASTFEGQEAFDLGGAA